MSYFLFYGSLRPGMYNYERFFNKNNHEVVLDNVRIKGYKLYDLGAYPAIKSSDLNDSVECTLIRIDDTQTIRIIHAMEIGAGYKANGCKLETDAGIIHANIYEYIDNIPEKLLIKSGDWVKHNEKVI